MAEDRSVLDRAAPGPDQSWAYGPGAAQVADGYWPEGGASAGPRPVVVLIHGGYWRPEYDRTHLRPMAAALAADGYPTVLLEYTRIPGDPDAAIDDFRLALTSLAEAVDVSAGVVLVGHSAGGHLALLAANHATVIGCLALAPVADLVMAEYLDLDNGAVHAFLGRPAADRPDLDPARHPVPAVPTTLLHGVEDTLVPAAMSEAYCSERGTRLVLLPGTAHFELIDPLSATWPSVMAELAALIPSSGIE
ncbi:MAG: alpha/beta hydrolase [Actinobacteria bacterium]|nr:alpha/beta hydrolase [Actinomycetota bacterium]